MIKTTCWTSNVVFAILKLDFAMGYAYSQQSRLYLPLFLLAVVEYTLSRMNGGKVVSWG